MPLRPAIPALQITRFSASALRSAAGPADRRRRGFALLITIVLVAFLVLILVTLASLTRVETQVASNSQLQDQARQNALMALNVAIGQLQKYTGPDQRITATADIAAAADGTRLPAGAVAQNTASVNGTVNGLSVNGTPSIQTGTRWWTGVWARSGGGYATPANSIYEETPSPVLLNWLVSGNEDRRFTTDASGWIASSDADGRTPANTSPFTPGAVVNWSAADLDPAAPTAWSGTANYADLEIKTSGQKAVLLVGPKTAGTDPVNGEVATERYVVAPLQDITAPSQSIGMGTSGDTTIGRYAWWVGDEGVKASYALADPNAGQTNPANDAEARLRLMSAARSGIELLPGWQDYPDADDTDAGVKLGRVLEMQQAPLLTPSLLPETQRAGFHDFARLSRGLLTDTLNGGLRQDLTHYFESTGAWNSSPLKGNGIIPAPYSPDWGSGALAPKWDWLYSFYNTNPAVGSPSLTVRPETGTELGVYPVITQLRMIFFTEDSRITNPKSLPAGQTFSLPMRGNVAIVLANPYNTELSVPSGDMEFVIKNNSTGSTGIVVRAADGAGKGKKDADGNVIPDLGTFGILRTAGNTTEPAGLLDTVKFSAPAFTIAPGGTVTLAVDGNGQTINASANAPDAEPANTVALAVRTGSNPIVSSDYFSAGTTLDFTTTEGGAGIALYQYSADLSLTMRKTTGEVYQRIERFKINKDNQVNSFSGIVLGTAHLKFIAPAQRSLDWTNSVQESTFAFYLYGRPYRDFNIRAGKVTHPNVTTNKHQYAMSSPPSYGAGVIAYAAGANGGGILFAAFTDSLHPAQWAEDFNDNYRQSALQGVLFDFPRRTTDQPAVTSIAQLQHANVGTNDETADGTIGFGSTYAIGNSYHNPFVTRGRAVETRANFYTLAPGGTSGSTRYFDLSYLLNTALWDSYFFSGIRQTGGDITPLNLRYELTDATVDPADVRNANSAAHLTVKGAFNINSTSKDAWIALLGSLNGLRVNTDSANTGVPFPRTLWQPVEEQNTFQTSGTGEEAYAGYRRLDTTELDSLATEIVKRVRARGPFVSLSHFINRSLVPASGDFNPDINDADGAGNLASATVPMGRGLAGPLQAAIDSAEAGINTFVTVGGDQVTGDAAGAYGDRVLFNGEIVQSDGAGGKRPNSNNTRDAYFADKQFDTLHTEWDMNETAKPGPNGRTSTGIPSWLMQGDVLQAIGPALSARSDTFVIRAYGEAVNPTDATDRQARAWCEAVVQRQPDYVEPAANSPEDALATLNPTNLALGRGYKVIGFRWLSADDI